MKANRHHYNAGTRHRQTLQSYHRSSRLPNYCKAHRRKNLDRAILSTPLHCENVLDFESDIATKPPLAADPAASFVPQPGWIERVDLAIGVRLHIGGREVAARQSNSARIGIIACCRDEGAASPGLRWHGRQRDGEREACCERYPRKFGRKHGKG
jgi:hypothetical protein